MGVVKVKIYILIDPITGIIRYVGKTTNTIKRFNKHINESKKSTTSHKKAWIRGLLNRGLKPKLEIIDEVPENEWEFWESYWISQIKTWGFNLTNTTSGGDGVNKGNIPWNKGTKGVMKSNETTFKKGNEIGLETRIKKGDRLNPETEFKKGGTPHNKGVSCSEETKNKLSRANKGNISSRRKPILQYSLDMVFINEYVSVTEAFNSTGINQTSIGQVARGERNKAGGYVWIYKT